MIVSAKDTPCLEVVVEILADRTFHIRIPEIGFDRGAYPLQVALGQLRYAHGPIDRYTLHDIEREVCALLQKVGTQTLRIPKALCASKDSVP